MDKEIVIVVATMKTQEEFSLTKEYTNIIATGAELKVVPENRTGLSEVYNRFFTEEYRDKIVCFIHDDLIIADIDFNEKLRDAHSSYHVVGLAGGVEIVAPIHPQVHTSWITLCSGYVNSKPLRHTSGFVAHQLDGKRGVQSIGYGETPQEVVLLDGLFLSFDMSVCLDAGIEFDERYKFHHYDLSVSVRAVLAGLKMTTWDIFVIHKSGGGYDSDGWRSSHLQFLQEYGNALSAIKGTTDKY